MLDKHIDPPNDEWDRTFMEESDYWIDDLYEEWLDKQEIALHNYECQIYNELDRRIRI